MPRFFVDSILQEQDTITLKDRHAQHAKVLRLSVGDEITVSDGHGIDYHCIIKEFENDLMLLSILHSEQSKSEPTISVSVYMAFSKGDKFEHVIQKATELGATEIIGFPSSRCIAKYDDKMLKKKLDRWQKIAESAAEQSGRGIIPTVLTVPTYTAALLRAAQADCALFFYENERSYTLSDALRQSYSTVALMSGPEGGFTEEETQKACSAGLLICSLGNRILRCETAPLCALSAVMYAAGEF